MLPGWVLERDVPRRGELVAGRNSVTHRCMIFWAAGIVTTDNNRLIVIITNSYYCHCYNVVLCARIFGVLIQLLYISIALSRPRTIVRYN